MNWFDSHCHLHICEQDRSVEDVLSNARTAGVTRMIAVGIDLASSQRALELTAHEGVSSSAGVHPNSANEWSPDVVERIQQLLKDERVRAVGETGLDFYRDYVAPDEQKRAFRDHITLSKSTDKALIIHTRDSIDSVLDELEERGAPDRLVFHCWSGDDVALKRALTLGGYISFAGNISFKNAPDLRDAAVQVPKDRLLVETDSPYLAPVPKRGKPNEPAFVTHVGEAVAAARGEDVMEVADLTWRNANALFSL